MSSLLSLADRTSGFAVTVEPSSARAFSLMPQMPVAFLIGMFSPRGGIGSIGGVGLTWDEASQTWGSSTQTWDFPGGGSIPQAPHLTWDQTPTTWNAEPSQWGSR